MPSSADHPPYAGLPSPDQADPNTHLDAPEQALLALLAPDAQPAPAAGSATLSVAPALLREQQQAQQRASLRQRLDRLFAQLGASLLGSTEERRSQRWWRVLTRRGGERRQRGVRAPRRGSWLQRVASMRLARLGLVATMVGSLALPPQRGYAAALMDPQVPVLVNSTTTNSQINPAVARAPSGDYVVVWQSAGQDGDGWGIYARLYNADRTPKGDEFLVNTTTTGWQYNPDVAMDNSGNFVVVWQSDDTSGAGIYARRFGANGAPIDTSDFLANETITDDQLSPSVAMDSDGDFVISWNSNPSAGGCDDDYEICDSDIFVRRFDKLGVAEDPESVVNTHVNSVQGESDVAMDDDGDFVVTWQSYPASAGGGGPTPQLAGSNPQIVGALQIQSQDASGIAVYAQRYAADGAPQGVEVQVNTYTWGNQSRPSVAMDGTGDFVIAWQSYYDSYYGNGATDDLAGIRAQRFAADGALRGAELLVNTTTLGYQTNPSVAIDSNGDFLVAWQSADYYGSYYDGLSGVYAQRFENTGNAQGAELVVSALPAEESGNAYNASVAMDASGDAIVAWEMDDGSNGGIYTLGYQNEPEPPALGEEISVNTYTSGDQRNPSTASDADGDYVVAWQSKGADSLYDIYAQRYNDAGVAQGAEFQISTGTLSHNLNPSVSMDANGSFVVVWQSGLALDGSDHDIYARSYAADGTPAGAPFLVNSEYTPDAQRSPSVALDDDDDFVVAWESFRDINYGGRFYYTYARRYENGLPGDEFLVAPTPGYQQHNPSVAIDDDGDTVIAWEQESSYNYSYDTRDLAYKSRTSIQSILTQYDIHARRYNNLGAPVGDPFLIYYIDLSNTDQLNPSVAMDSDGDFVIAWESPDSFDYGWGTGIYAKQFKILNGDIQTSFEFRVNTVTANQQTLPSSAMDADGDFIVTWQSMDQDGALGGVYAQRYSANGCADGSEFRVNTFTANQQGAPSTAMSAAGYVVIAWESNNQRDASSGYDINAALLGTPSPLLTMSIAAGSNPAEPSTSGSFVVTLNAPAPAGGLTLSYTLGGSASYSSDYGPLSGSVTIPAGQTSAIISVPVINDALYDPSETVKVTLSPGCGYVLSVSSATLTIGDDDLSYSVGTSAASLTEGNSGSQSVTFTITRSGATDRASTVDFSLGGSASHPTDYNNIGGTSGATGTSGAISFSAGQTSKTITLDVLGDTVFESDETITVTLSNPAVTSPATGTASIATATATTTIANDDTAIPSASIAAGTNPAEPSASGSFTVTLDAPAPAGGITVNYTVGGTASAGSDYTTLSGSVVIPAGQTSAIISVAALNDGLVDPGETVVVTLASGSGYQVGSSGSASLTIGDDDLSYSVGTSSASLTEGNSGGQSVTFTITRSGATDRASTVDFSIGGTASHPIDYNNIGGTGGATGTSGTLSFSAGQTSKTITLDVLGDTGFEADETVVVTLSNPAITSPATGTASIATASATTTIANDDLRAASIVAGANPTEPSGTGTFTVTLDAPAPAGGITVNYNVGGTATPGDDYTALSGSVFIAEGQTSAQISVAVQTDQVVDPGETVIVTLASGTGYQLGSASSATMNIIDTAVPSASITANTNPAEPDTNGSLSVTLDVVAPTGGITVSYTVGGTAGAGSDYTLLSGSVVIPAGQTNAIISVAALDDALVDPGETVVVTIVNADGYQVGSSGSATLTIGDDDLSYSVGTSASSLTEGNSGAQSVTFTITRSGATDRASTVDFSIGGTASHPTDYNNIGGTGGATGTSGTLSFSAGQTSKTITLDVLGDTGFEADETVVVTLSNPAITSPATGTASIASASATTTISNDDLRAASIVAGANPTEPSGTGTFTVTLDAPAPAGGITVNYSVGGTATPGDDYTALSGSVFIPEGQSSAVITVTPFDDDQVDRGETVVVTLTGGTGYQLGSASGASLTIGDEDRYRYHLPSIIIQRTHS